MRTAFPLPETRASYYGSHVIQNNGFWLIRLGDWLSLLDERLFRGRLFTIAVSCGHNFFAGVAERSTSKTNQICGTALRNAHVY